MSDFDRFVVYRNLGLPATSFASGALNVPARLVAILRVPRTDFVGAALGPSSRAKSSEVCAFTHNPGPSRISSCRYCTRVNAFASLSSSPLFLSSALLRKALSSSSELLRFSIFVSTLRGRAREW